MNKKSFLITALLVFVFTSAVYGQPWTGSGDTTYGEVEDYTTTVVADSSLRLYPTDDAYVTSEYPSNNYGSESYLRVDKDDDTYIKFDLSVIPDGYAIVSACLRLAVSSVSSTGPDICPLFIPDDSWSESTITWSNTPEDNGWASNDLHRIYGDEIIWDIYPAIPEDAYSTDGTCSFLFKMSYFHATQFAWFYSKEYSSDSFRPYLEVTYTRKFGGGDGSAEDPYQIWTPNDLYLIGVHPKFWNKHFILMTDLDLTSHPDYEYQPIGSGSTGGDQQFRGVFDGNHHTISNFSHNPSFTSDTYIGLFGSIGYSGHVRDLGLINPHLAASTNYHVGALAGFSNGIITNCWVEGGDVSGRDNVGGLIGNNRGYVAYCYADTSVSGDTDVGGLIGISLFGEAHCCYASGAVTGSDTVGGFAGYLDLGIFKDCYATSAVSGDTNVGGFVGKRFYDDDANSPWHYDNVVACLWDTDTSGQGESAGGTGLPTVDMQNMDTFINAGWDLVGEMDNGPSDDWAEPLGGGYPILGWQLSTPPSLPTFAGGTGEPPSPYLIGSVQQLNSIGHNPQLMGKHFHLITDLDLAGAKIHTIGNRALPFCGTFDGDHHCLDNFHFTVDYLTTSVALFNRVDDPNAALTNLILANPHVHADLAMDVGSLVGTVLYGKVDNCHAYNANVSGYTAVGGLIGDASWSSVSRCSGTGNVSASGADYANVGGLIGENLFLSETSLCFADVTVTGTGYVGGLIGSFGATSTLSNSYARGPVNSMSYSADVGGLLGRNMSGQVISCYASGLVSAPNTTDVGALVGGSGGSTVSYTNCFFDATINPSLPGIGNTTEPNVAGLPTVLMQTASTFTDAGWDFVGEVINGPNDIWDICEGTNYPKLAWSIPAADFICPDGVNMLDFAILGDAWFTDPNMPNWDPACDISEPNDNVIDALDLDVFTDNYLSGF